MTLTNFVIKNIPERFRPASGIIPAIAIEKLLNLPFNHTNPDIFTSGIGTGATIYMGLRTNKYHPSDYLYLAVPYAHDILRFGYSLTYDKGVNADGYFGDMVGQSVWLTGVFVLARLYKLGEDVYKRKIKEHRRAATARRATTP